MKPLEILQFQFLFYIILEVAIKRIFLQIQTNFKYKAKSFCFFLRWQAIDNGV